MRRKHNSNYRNVANFEGMTIYANNSDSDSEMDSDKHISGTFLFHVANLFAHKYSITI